MLEYKQTTDELLNRIGVPGEELHLLIELGYRSKQKAERQAADRLDIWAAKQPFAIDMLRRLLCKNER